MGSQPLSRTGRTGWAAVAGAVGLVLCVIEAAIRCLHSNRRPSEKVL